MEKTNLQNNGSRLWKKATQAIAMTALLAAIILAHSISASAQFTFVGDYDKTFAAPFGYYVDPEDVDPTVEDYQTLFNTGELLPDGSIIAGGRHLFTFNGGTNDFYLRKFLPTGAVDASFGTNGFVRTNFYYGVSGPGNPLIPSNDLPQVLKVQPDGRILLAGQCNITAPEGIPWFGTDACVMRYNPNGSIDTSFGNVSVMTGGGLNPQGTQNPSFSYVVGEGRFITQTGALSYPGNPGPRRGTGGIFYDMAIQPDGKIVLVGETQNEYDSGNPSVGGYPGIAAFIMRLNANGTRDDSFGTNGIVQMAADPAFTGCYPRTGFHGMRLQADGRIIAVGYTSVARAGDCFQGRRFAVTRWTANGQAESLRYLDNITTYTDQKERATTAHFTRDGSKIIVSGSYDCKASLVRLNGADLSIDTTFGTNGIAGYAQGCQVSPMFGPTLYVKAIQPDGKFIGVDTSVLLGSIVRLNPNGSNDQSFGNEPFDGTAGLRGRLRVFVTNFNGVSNSLEAGDLLVRPNGRINLIGYSAAHAGLGILRGAISQQNTNLQNGVYADFENDGKDNLAVYRPGEGNWHNLDSRNNSYSVFAWGISSDKIAPADYDGDGITDRAVFRDGTWYVSQSSNGQVRIVNFGLAGDLPRPGDFDGDGLADISVFRPSDGIWYRLNSSNGSFGAIQFGQNGDVPMLGDYDGDGKTDFTVFRPSNAVWYVFRSSDNQVQVDAFGTNGDIPLNGDFNGDSRADLAVFRPSNRTWYIARPTGAPGQNFDAIAFGLSTDVPVAADYDNDGKTDVAIYRNGSWWIQRSGTNDVINTQFGSSGDKPVPAAYLP